jgi:hypothetical protein
MIGNPGILVVGAGVSGLACGKALAEAGRSLQVLERARGVGGRCTTRRIEGQPVDLGPVFLHGRSSAFLEALEAVPSESLHGWPSDLHGTGRPCQPEAFAPGERRIAYCDGLSAFPNWLAVGQEIQTEAEAIGLETAGPRIQVLTKDGGRREAGTVVLALAPEQVLQLFDGRSGGGTLEAGAPKEVATLRALLGFSRSEPCLTLAALYSLQAPAPPWQVCYPEDSRVVQLVSHDSSKRRAPSFRALLFQAHPRWSGEHLEDPGWTERILEEAGRIVAPWAAEPLFQHAHRWRFARTGRAGELSGPLLIRLPGGSRLGVCGDRFASGGGVEGAWLSGRALARRILEEEQS